jgi:hypothetical protein
MRSDGKVADFMIGGLCVAVATHFGGFGGPLRVRPGSTWFERTRWLLRQGCAALSATT